MNIVSINNGDKVQNFVQSVGATTPQLIGLAITALGARKVSIANSEIARKSLVFETFKDPLVHFVSTTLDSEKVQN